MRPVDEGLRRLTNGLDPVCCEEVDGALALEESVLGMEPLADAPGGERVREQEYEVAKLSEPVVPVGADVARPPGPYRSVRDLGDRGDVYLSDAERLQRLDDLTGFDCSVQGGSTRTLGRRCEDCNLFCVKIGPGGECPACSELVAAAELDGGDPAGLHSGDPAGLHSGDPAGLHSGDPAGLEGPVVGVDVLDAVELAEILDYISEWLTGAPPAVTSSLSDHGGGPDAPTVLLDALARHSAALTTTVPL